jgi:regulator of protease activity HflC (stomatin/prohibitin superfamily)
MPFVKAQPNEYLVVGRSGKITSRGLAASAFIWPGSTYVLIPSTQQEATFEMTQESKDCIPLRFKGIVIYHVAHAELAARQFNFAQGGGVAEINKLITHICLGELRAAVAHRTMDECIEQRKTTLTNAVAAALAEAIGGNAERPGWGIALDVVQVAQVFIVDQELRRQLEAEVRNSVKMKSDLSDLQTRESVQRAEAASQRRLLHEQLEAEREKSTLEQEKLRLKTSTDHEKLRLRKEYEQAEIETNHPLEQFRIEKEMERLQKQLDKRVLENRLAELQLQATMLPEQARHQLRKELLPLKQAPAIAGALSGLFQGLHMTAVGQDLPMLGALLPVLDILTQKVREAFPMPSAVPAANEDKGK